LGELIKIIYYEEDILFDINAQSICSSKFFESQNAIQKFEMVNYQRNNGIDNSRTVSIVVSYDRSTIPLNVRTSFFNHPEINFHNWNKCLKEDVYREEWTLTYIPEEDFHRVARKLGYILDPDVIISSDDDGPDDHTLDFYYNQNCSTIQD